MPMLRLQQAQNRPLTRKIKNVWPAWPSWTPYPKTPTKTPIFQSIQDVQPQIPWPSCPSPRSRSAVLCVPCGEHPAAAAAVTPNSQLLTPRQKKLVDLVDLDNLTPEPQRRTSASEVYPDVCRDGKKSSSPVEARTPKSRCGRSQASGRHGRRNPEAAGSANRD